MFKGHNAITPSGGVSSEPSQSKNTCVAHAATGSFENDDMSLTKADAVFAQWTANWLVTITFPVMASKLGPAIPYFVYLVFAAASFDVVRRAVPETKGRTLEEATAS